MFISNSPKLLALIPISSFDSFPITKEASTLLKYNNVSSTLAISSLLYIVYGDPLVIAIFPIVSTLVNSFSLSVYSSRSCLSRYCTFWALAPKQDK